MLDVLTTPRFSDATNALTEYWRRLPRIDGSLCPRKADFSIVGVITYAAEIFMSEWVSPTELRILQAGTRLEALLGEDLTQCNIFEVLPPQLLPSEKEYYNNLRCCPCAGVITRQALNLKGRPFVYRTVQLPLTDDDGKTRYFVGAGSVLTEESIREEFGSVDFDNIKLLERQYLDIGAGRPS
ncbi:MAG: PAS domain-containing protein [Kordiimonas sp.]